MDTYLIHHGIKGQKWGVRRYRNSDGSYTKAGRKRYGLDLDLTDKSRKNVAKIRTGEAKRRLDTAKANNDTNKTRIADLQARVRSAKKNERMMGVVDKGAKLASKGETILGNKRKMYYANAAAYVGSKALTGFLNSRMSTLSSQGRWTAGHRYVAEKINKYGGYSMQALAMGYSLQKIWMNYKYVVYYYQTFSGETSLKRVGSQEYADRVKEKKK